MTLISCTLLITSYLLGSIPFGLLIGRLRGVDIREKGSGNIGATNVFRCVGKKWGALAFVLDFMKGLCGAALLPIAAEALTATTIGPDTRLACGLLAIIGHNYPVFLKFKGGKGIATSGGVLAGIAPWTILGALIVWALLFVTTRYVSVASIGAAWAAGISGWVLYRDSGAIPWALLLLAVMATWRHRSNIQRLVKGEENRFNFSKRRKQPPEPENS